MISTSSNSYTRGMLAEKIVLNFLKKKGLKPLKQNYHGPGGEIDLIMMDNNIIVFIEVRYRANNRYLHALESIDQGKCERIIKTGLHYLQTKCRSTDNPCRFDVVAVCGDIDDPEIGWIKDAFQA